MKMIKLQNSDKVALIDNEDYDLVKPYLWSLLKRKHRNHVFTYVGCKVIYMHSLILPCSRPKEVDHANGEGLNNQQFNLRICYRSNNAANKSKTKSATSSKYKGVSWIKRDNLWDVRLTKNYKQIIIGHFKTEREAAIAYNEAALRYFGEFAKLNIIEPE